MNAIGGIIDMDGFTVRKKFYCKELGILKIGEEVGTSYHFTLPFRYADLNIQDRKNVEYVIRKINKLPIFTKNSLPLERLENIVVDFYKNNRQLPIAYKGGNFERNLLQKLNIPAINLEVYGCPKASELFKNMIWIETCGKHIGKDTHLHCPKCEVEAYGIWYKTKETQDEQK